MPNYVHLSLNERKIIEEMLSHGFSFSKIADKIQRNRNTISREVQKNAVVKRTGAVGQPFNNCSNRKTCGQYALCKKEGCSRDCCKGCKFCFRLCPDFKREGCGKLKGPPYVCNGCGARHKCTLEKFIYIASEAQRAYGAVLATSRSGIAITPEELTRIDKIVSPLIRQGQSLHAILVSHKDEIMLDESTLYRYVKSGLFTASATDLLNMVKMKPRRKKAAVKIERACRTGRTYRDFLAFMDENPDTPVVQMDTVIGKTGSGEAVLLTVHFVTSELMLAFKRAANTARSVNEVVGRLYALLGENVFTGLFPVILLDNGSEFSNPSSIEYDIGGKQRTKVFYTDPGAPYQKGACENNHSLVRRVIRKGESLNSYSQAEIDLLMNHINSYPRKKLKGRCAAETFSFFHSQDILKSLGVDVITPDAVVLNPSLLKK